MGVYTVFFNIFLTIIGRIENQLFEKLALKNDNK